MTLSHLFELQPISIHPQLYTQMLMYLTVSLDIHLSAQDEWLQVDVGLWGDGPSFPRLADHSQPFVETPLVIELSQVRLAVHLDAVLHVGVTTHQALHIAHVKLF